MRRYDRPTTFFFCDPPDTGCGDVGHKPWTDADVLRLRELLSSIRGKWLVTRNDAPAICGIFAECEITSVERAMGIGVIAV